jgi:peptide/nickel transport system ATP-binding protein
VNRPALLPLTGAVLRLAACGSIAHRVAVMRHGRIVELGATRDLFADPGHDYTRELLAAIPGSSD